ncbi:MAG TPA: hypothetical protein VGU22_05100 [Methylomirabilota bacterium]|jgi:hypothetical protein|nr:hypothetical protein [Methylomirabilota bacterium]
MFGVIIGLIAGGLGVYYYGDRIRRYVDEKLPDVRTKAADGLQVLERKVGENLRAAERAARPPQASDTLHKAAGDRQPGER